MIHFNSALRRDGSLFSSHCTSVVHDIEYLVWYATYHSHESHLVSPAVAEVPLHSDKHLVDLLNWFHDGLDDIDIVIIGAINVASRDSDAKV